MHIYQHLIIFLTAIVILVLLVRFSHLLGLVDTPNERSVHKKITPRSGGVAIFLSVAIVYGIFNIDLVLTHYYLHLSVLLIFVVGLIDDRFDISPRIKFIAIFFATIMLYQENIYIENLGTYFDFTVSIPLLLIFPFTFFAIAGFTNALNLVDGLDGLAGTVSLIILTTFLAIGFAYHDPLIISLSASFIAALIAFLIFNWNPAKIFMGDSGSLTLGFMIAVLSIFSLQYVTPTAIVFIIAMPILDTFIVMTRRIQRGKSPFEADKNHIHHFLYKVKGDVRFTVTLLVAIQAIFSIIGFQLREEDDFLSLILFSLLFYTFLNLFDQRLRHRKKSKQQSKMKKNAIQKSSTEANNIIETESAPGIIAPITN